MTNRELLKMGELTPDKQARRNTNYEEVRVTSRSINVGSRTDPFKGSFVDMSSQTTFIPGLSDPRLTRFYDPIMKWVLWEEFIRRPLVDAVQAAPGHTITDVGCGTGTLTIPLAQAVPAATVIGLDVDGAMLAQAHAKVAEAGSGPALVQGSAVALL